MIKDSYFKNYGFGYIEDWIEDGFILMVWTIYIIIIQ